MTATPHTLAWRRERILRRDTVDLSQAGRTAGITGSESGLVAHVFRLLEGKDIEWLVLENVRNMLVLDGGKPMAYLVRRLEELRFRWA